MDFNVVCTKIQELLIKNEEVILPGTGKFVVDSFPAAFLEDGKTIVPPSKKLRFIPITSVEDGVSASEGYEDILVELSGRIQEALVENGEFEVPGFGIFTNNGAGEVNFTVAEEFDFAPDNFALESISLEENDPVVKTVAPEEKVAGKPEIHDVAAKKETRRKLMMWTITAVVFLAVVVLFLILFKEDMKGILQNLLYTKEELEIMQKWAEQ